MANLTPGVNRPLVWLNEATAARTEVGGKGASLSLLSTHHAPVPLACALTTAAWRQFAATVGLPSCASADDLADIRAAILTAPLDAEIDRTINDCFATFCARMGDNPALAVRSSAVAEDSAQFSFAGLHDTVLDVRTPTDLERAIRQCWASLWSDRAHAYRTANQLVDDAPEIAVVIQQLVRSDVSFVVFTTDPITDRADHLVITATWGLGEAIVAGLTVPDHIVVGLDGTILEYRIGDKHLMVIPGGQPGEGMRQVSVPRSLRAMAALTPDQVTGIATMARSLSARLGYAADIEGGLCANLPYLFQARPITTGMIPVNDEVDDGLPEQAIVEHANSPPVVVPSTGE